MKVRARGRFRHGGRIVQPGEVLDLPDDAAALQLRRGYVAAAEEAPVSPPPPSRASSPSPAESGARRGYRRRDMRPEERDTLGQAAPAVEPAPPPAADEGEPPA